MSVSWLAVSERIEEWLAAVRNSDSSRGLEWMASTPHLMVSATAMRWSTMECIAGDWKRTTCRVDVWQQLQAHMDAVVPRDVPGQTLFRGRTRSINSRRLTHSPCHSEAGRSFNTALTRTAGAVAKKREREKKKPTPRGINRFHSQRRHCIERCKYHSTATSTRHGTKTKTARSFSSLPQSPPS